MDTQKRKSRFLKVLEEKRGIITDACKAAGVSRTTFYAWRDSDPDFKRAASEVEETQLDFVESKLLQNIESGDTTAIIFYLKAKGKRRGWNENYDRVSETEGEESFRVRAISPVELMERQEEKRRLEESMNIHPLTNLELLSAAIDAPREKVNKDFSWRIKVDDEENAQCIIDTLQDAIVQAKKHFVGEVLGTNPWAQSVYRTDIQKGFEKGWLTEEQYKQGLARHGRYKSCLEESDPEERKLAARVEEYLKTGQVCVQGETKSAAVGI